ncbi:MAG: thiamine phosphate synthase [Pseudomonadota bacterium]
MADTDTPQIYLISPLEFEMQSFRRQLETVLDAAPVACMRLSMASQDADRISRAGDMLRELTHARDIPLVISDHVALAERLGLDGVHLTDGARAVRTIRKDLGKEAIIGAFCGASRHDGLNAGEAGADYVAFGPARATGLGHTTPADPELFGWWSEMIELPVIAEGALDPDTVSSLRDTVDFFALGDEIWQSEAPEKALSDYARLID